MTRLNILRLFDQDTPLFFSYSNFGQKEFSALLNNRTDIFGWQNFDFNVSVGIGEDWLYTASVYQNFDPDISKYGLLTSQTVQIYHAGLTHLLSRGNISLRYKYSNSSALGSMINSVPFIYTGDGGVKEQLTLLNN